MKLLQQSRTVPLLLGLTLLVGSLSPAIPARAAGTPDALSLQAAVRVLQSYNVVDRKPESELRLDDPITRAEFAKMIGSALKEQGGTASGQAAFADTAGHWANGWIAAAKRRGLLQGSEGLFRPDAEITAGEVLTVLLRLTGYAQDAGLNWPWGAVTAAADKGMIPREMQLTGKVMEPATRSNVFWLTAMAIGRIPLAGSSQTLLQKHQDTAPPALDLSGLPDVVSQSSAVVQGKAGDAVAVLVNGNDADLAEDGTFTQSVGLEPGKNEIQVTATDGAGNRAMATVNILRQELARVAIEPATVTAAVGQTFSLAVLRYDASGASVPATNAAWVYDSGGLTFDPAAGTFKANRPGDYIVRASVEGREASAQVSVAGPPARLELTVSQPTLVADGLPTAVTVRVLDRDGRLSPAGNQPVQFTLVPNGIMQMDTTSVMPQNGVATGYLKPGATLGGAGVQASIPGSPALRSALIPVIVVQRQLSGLRIETIPAHSRPVAGRHVEIIATAVDQSGAPIRVLKDLAVDLSTSAGSVLRLDHARAVIRAGASSSAFGGQNGSGVTQGASGEAAVSGHAGSLLAPAARFTAKAGGPLSRLRVQVDQDVALSDGLSAAVVAVERLDENGAVSPDDQTPLVLLPSRQDVAISPVRSVGGVDTFAIRSGAQGTVTLRAGVPGRPEFNSEPVTVAFSAAAASARPVIRTASPVVTEGESVELYVALDGSQGGAVPNPGPAITFQLKADGASLSSAEAVIPSGGTRSESVLLTAPVGARSLSVTGAMVGGKPLPPAQLSVAPRQAPPPVQEITGYNLAVQAPASGQSLRAGDESRFVVQARDGGSLLKGSHAFSLKVRLNGREVTDLPPELRITVGGNSIQYITPRTVDGEAEVWVRYTGTGTVELEPVPASADWQAYDQWGVAGPADGTDEFRTAAGRVTYSAGPLDHLDAVVTPNLGDSLHGVLRAVTGRFATVRLTPSDVFGNPAGNSCSATLTQLPGQQDGLLALRSGALALTEQTAPVGPAGYAEFTITALTDRVARSEWAASMVCGNTPMALKQNIAVETTVNSAPDPSIEYIGGDLSGQGRLTDRDASLRIRIGRISSAPDSYQLLVYNGSTMIGAFGPVVPRSSVPGDRTVSLPRSSFPAWDQYMSISVRLYSGAGVSDPSAAAGVIVSSQ